MSETIGDTRLRLVDVGGAGGIQAKWLPFADQVLPIMFEPNIAEAAKLRGTLESSFAESLVMETGLAEGPGTRSLDLARHYGCTSLREPDVDFLASYRIGRNFRVTGTVEVACTRYDALHEAGAVPRPDAIKIDVQGYEYEVLQGFGALLQTCLAIELEAHIYPIYRGQKLLHDLIAFLRNFGFIARRLHPKGNFDGDVVEADVCFTKDIHAWRKLEPLERGKFALVTRAWNLVDYASIDRPG